MKSYSIFSSKDQKKTFIINNIKEIVRNKLDTLLEILFEDDKLEWCRTLNIEDSHNDDLKHYDQLIKILRFMQNFKNIDDIPLTLINSFSQNFLLTHELNIIINKLIVSYLKSNFYS